jgi:disulfide bond formation protein DsbB
VVDVSPRWKKLGLVARFELGEALRSRLVVVVLCLYGAGAGVGAFGFVMALDSAERAARTTLEGSMSAHDIPPDVVRREALPRLIQSLVDDRELQKELLQIDPLALFYGFAALHLVAALVLLTSGGTHASDIGRGATRFVLTRCDRLSWALGKALGQAALLALGLSVGALVTAAVGLWQSRFDPTTLLWLGRASFRALVYGLAYLGIFVGLALAVRSPARARAACVLALFGLWLGHTLCRAQWVSERMPLASALCWLFPGEYQGLLWSPSWLVSSAAALALLGLGALAFVGGYASFRRSDA